MSDLFSEGEWFAIVSHPGRQQQAKEALERQRYRVFLPMGRTQRRHAGKTEVVERPLFDRYLFVGRHSEQPFTPITNTRGVAFVVRGVGGIPCRVSPLALRAVKRRCDADGGSVNLIPGGRVAQWRPEQPLRVLDGPFKDFVGLFAGGSGETAKILLDLFGQPTLTSLPEQSLEPVVPPRTAVAIVFSKSQRA